MHYNNQSAEDYLETILLLKKSMGEIRSIDIVNKTGYKKSSISVAMKKLRESEFIVVDKNGYICFTEKGKTLAESIYIKHECLKKCFIKMGVSETCATEDACKIEHEISEETFKCMVKYFGI